jgi:hypothetical protein
MLSDHRLVSVGKDGMVFLWEGGERDQWLDHVREDEWNSQRRKKCPRLQDLEEEEAGERVEFMPAIMRNYLREGEAAPAPPPR